VRTLLIVLAVLSSGCGAAASPPVSSVTYASYQYTVAVPTQPLAPNEVLHLVWEPKQAAGSASAISDLQLCVALFGPWDSVEALKKAMSGAEPRPSCPPDGAIAASDTIRTTSNSGARFTADLAVPSAPGFYDLHQISITSAGGATSTMRAGGIIEVRKR
jgi:hypothetical protein